ncbi:glycosyltransferase [Bradyrhizobium sp. McL0616]|uniref:glycosyltransferase n=1 Tax=Bradyrhizobium sp. McL0616 TaxID=3415674 RepID=UPI003CE79E50
MFQARRVASPPLISVVIPVRNEGRRLRSTISSIMDNRSCPFPIQIIVIDDASSDGCCSAALKACSSDRNHASIEIVRLPRWSGIPYARNVGAGLARAPILFMTDANVRFPRCWDHPIRDHIGPGRVICAAIADAESQFVGFGGTLHVPSMGFDWVRTLHPHGNAVPLSPSTGTIIPTELFRRVGGYDTAMPIYGAAEPELSVRVWLSGAEIVCIPGLVLKHHFKSASEKKPFLKTIEPTLVYNYIRFGLLYLDRMRMEQMLTYYSNQFPLLFKDALRRAWVGDVWNRRSLLERILPRTFADFVRQFKIVDATGQSAA